MRRIRNLQRRTICSRSAWTGEGETDAGIGYTALDQARQALADADRKLAEQTKAANALAAEKTALQAKLDQLAASTPTRLNSLPVRRRSRRLTLSSRAIQARLRPGTGEGDLQARLKTLSADAEPRSAAR